MPRKGSVNYPGPFLMTLLLEDTLKRCADGAESPNRVLNVSSVIHHFSTLAKSRDWRAAAVSWSAACAGI